MGNNTPDSKFDDTIKDSLKNYEGNENGSDWARMERMLDAAPKVMRFKWSYMLSAFVGIAVLAGGYFIYSAVSNKKPSADEEVVAPENKITPADNTRTKPQIVKPAVKSPEPAVTPVMKDQPPAPVSNIIIPPVTENKEKVAAEKILTDKKNKQQKSKAAEEAEYNKNQKVFGMGNEPVFGDMIDSSKGIVNETKEKESTKKAAKNTTTYPVGWNSIMLSNVNLDSLKKYREKKDSVK
ncbi:MAG: hypothetical protein M3R27_00090 [Bacteroidota bacterium]|nr:hypothetical protein [Bacteroidota bacterium]